MIDLYHLHQEAEPTERTAVEAVVDHITAEIARLEAAQVSPPYSKPYIKTLNS